MRNYFIDYLKGVAIFLVVWGHCIQYGTHGSYLNFFNDPLFIAIYSFHMPLFMGISGYLFYNGLHRRSIKETLTRRFKQIVVPLLLWSTIAIPDYSDIQVDLSLEGVWYYVGIYIKHLPTLLWFLWTLFFLSAIVTIVAKTFKDKILAYIVAFVILMLLPDDYGNSYIKFMAPFFIGGYLLNRVTLTKWLIHVFGIGSILIYIVLMRHWNLGYFVYMSNLEFHMDGLAGQIKFAMSRYVLGTAGAIAFTYVLYYCLYWQKLKFISVIGQYTLGIYIISMLFNPFILRLGVFDNNRWFFGLIFTPILAIGITAICYWLSKIISKQIALNRLLLGGK